LNFESKGESQKEVNLVPQRKEPLELEKLHENLEMLKHLGNQSERKGMSWQGSIQVVIHIAGILGSPLCRLVSCAER